MLVGKLVYGVGMQMARRAGNYQTLTSWPDRKCFLKHSVSFVSLGYSVSSSGLPAWNQDHWKGIFSLVNGKKG